MYQKYLSPILYLMLISFILSTSSSYALAAGQQGVPATLDELQTIKDQLASLQQTVSDLSGYIKSETASTGEAYTEICYNAKLGVLADGTIAVQGINKSGVGTGVDLYGLLDIDAGIEGNGQAQLTSMLESGVDMTVKMCLNAGVTNVATTPRTNEPIPAPAGLDSLLDSTRIVMNDVYADFPVLVASLPVGPENIVSGIGVLTNATSGFDNFSATRLLSQTGWNDAVQGLPGSDALQERYDALGSTFAILEGTDVCGYYTGLGSTLDPSLGNFVNTTCSAVPPGIDTSVAAIADVIDLHYNNITGEIPYTRDQLNSILGVTNSTFSFLTSTTQSTLNNIKNTVDDIEDSLP